MHKIVCSEGLSMMLSSGQDLWKKAGSWVARWHSS